MHGFSIEAITFYAAVYATAFVCTVTRAIRDSDWRDLGNLLGLGGTAGFLSCGIVAFLGAGSGAADWNRWYFLAVSVFIGILSKDQDKIARLAFSGVIKGLRAVVDAAEKDKQK